MLLGQKASDVPWTAADIRDRARPHQLDEPRQQSPIQRLSAKFVAELQVVRAGDRVISRPRANRDPAPTSRITRRL